MEGGRIFPKPTPPLSFMKTYRMSIISAGFISLDSTFKRFTHLSTYFYTGSANMETVCTQTFKLLASHKLLL